MDRSTTARRLPHTAALFIALEIAAVGGAGCGSHITGSQSVPVAWVVRDPDNPWWSGHEVPLPDASTVFIDPVRGPR